MVVFAFIPCHLISIGFGGYSSSRSNSLLGFWLRVWRRHLSLGKNMDWPFNLGISIEPLAHVLYVAVT